MIACIWYQDEPECDLYYRRHKFAKKFFEQWVKSWLKMLLQTIEHKTHTWLGPTLNYRRRRKRYACMLLPTIQRKLHIWVDGAKGGQRRSRPKRWRRTAVVRVLAMTVVAANAMPAQQGHEPARRVVFDTDSRPLKIDNHASKSITNDIHDVIGQPDFDTKYHISGVGGNIKGYPCTIRWTIEDDDGVRHDIKLPNAIYSKDSPSRILSPQHWAQEAKDNSPNPRGTWCATYEDSIVLHWNQEQYVRTVRLDKKGTNVATIRTSPGYRKYKAFQAEVGDDQQLYCYDANVISDDEEGEESRNVPKQNEAQDEWTLRKDPLTTDFMPSDDSQLEPSPVHIVEDEEDSRYRDASSEFLQWHHRLGHISPKKIREMARQGRLPSKLATCKVPLCTSCLFGKATKRPWRGKPSIQSKDKVETVTRPGQCVAVDQLESHTPGLIAQVKGIPTTDRYRCATVFVDIHTGIGYVHLQRTTSASETIEAKHAFERYAGRHAVQVEHYHADNGCFAENKFLEDIKQRGQTISFSGVGAHHQNGVAERRIRELQEHARTMLIHARTRWPEAIDVHLWPYALRAANDILNSTWDLKRKHIPLEKFTKTPVQDDLKQWAPFGCPVYVTEKPIQDGNNISKWQIRSRVAIYLGRSPNHARTVALCLSLSTGLTSPQFHFRLDPTFQTMRKAFRISMPASSWQAKCHFTKSKSQRDKPTQAKEPATPRSSNQATQNTSLVQGTAPTGHVPNQQTDPTINAPIPSIAASHNTIGTTSSTACTFPPGL